MWTTINGKRVWQLKGPQNRCLSCRSKPAGRNKKYCPDCYKIVSNNDGAKELTRSFRKENDREFSESIVKAMDAKKHG